MKSHRFLEDIVTADVAFEATGGTLEELLEAAADALLAVMVEPTAIGHGREAEIRVTEPDEEMLLFSFLQELVFLKDARRLLLKVLDVQVTREGDELTATAVGIGEEIDIERHPLIVDVKAVTLHLFRVERTEEGWRATVVLDI